MLLRTLSAVLLSLPLVANAATFTTLVPEKSEIQFHYEQMGVNMDGFFKGIDGSLHFDTDAPEKAQVTLEVQMQSVDTGSEEADSEVVKKEWFNASDFPTATFKAQSITPKADNEYEVAGLLSIKGHEQTIRFPAKVETTDEQATFSGSFSLLRGDYAIGEGAWSKFDIVANDVRIDFTIIATP